MNKEEYIKSLKKVKIVIGNGFDLHCGLHTKYSDYYCKNHETYRSIQNLYKEYSETDRLELNFDDNKISTLNIWDIFFALNSSTNPKTCKKTWCDIETLMLSSFIRIENNDKNIGNISMSLMSNVNWHTIKDCVVRRKLAINHRDRFVAELCKRKMMLKDYARHDFYQFLLNELKDFEKAFGDFVYYQLHNKYLENCNYGSIFLNKDYIKYALYTLNELCNKNNIVGIDSFNYSYIHDEKIAPLVQHINGSYENPIFGIDTIFEPKDEEFIFTKTCRRIDADLIDPSFERKAEFENLVVFGHSLNEADYSYFFPIFDKLKLTDANAINVVVFAFSIFDRDKEFEIQSNLRQAISNILYAYAKSKNLNDPKRFLDMLSTQKRIITYEILELNKTKSSFDIEWDRIYKEIDSTDS